MKHTIHYVPRPKVKGRAQARWRGFKDTEDPNAITPPEKIPGLKYWKKNGVVLFDRRGQA